MDLDDLIMTTFCMLDDGRADFVAEQIEIHGPLEKKPRRRWYKVGPLQSCTDNLGYDRITDEPFLAQSVRTAVAGID